MLDLTETPEETVDDVMIATYVLAEGIPFIYWGELYFDLEDKEQRKIILKRPLLQIVLPKEMTLEPRDRPPPKFVEVPSSGKDSIIVLDTFTIKGILVKNPDPDQILEYKNAFTRKFSKLHLL